MTADDATADDGFAGHVFLVIDGWRTLRQDYEELEPTVIDIAQRGLPYGIHVMAAGSGWMDFRPAVRDSLGSRLELRLGDPNDSMINRRAAQNVPARPGRGIAEGPLHMLTVLSDIPAVQSLAASLSHDWPGPLAPRVRLLPAEIPYAELVLDRSAGTSLPIGVAEADLRQVELDFAAEPHLLVFGDSECGKSSFLRALATTITTRFTPEQARIVLVDYRRSLLTTPGLDAHLLGRGSEPQKTLGMVEEIARSMRTRLSGPEWRGPELFLLVDDYDLVAGGGVVNPLTPLLDFLPQARDIGLHLVITRPVGGASRALYEPVLQRLRELPAAGLLMSGSREEGVLIGGLRPSRLPPGRGRLVTRREGERLIQLAHLKEQG